MEVLIVFKRLCCQKYGYIYDTKPIPSRHEVSFPLLRYLNKLLTSIKCKRLRASNR